MLDTVTLTLPDADFVITSPALFGPEDSVRGGGWRRPQNASPKEKRKNVTRPALTWSKRSAYGSSESLRIEFSVPKLLLGSNLAEVTEADLLRAAERLSDVLAGMGAAASPEALMAAKVSKVHFSKNIVLPAGTSVSIVLLALAGASTSGRSDNNRISWPYGGQGFRLHTTQRELIFYDKLADMKKASWSWKRSVDPLSGGLPLGEASMLPAGAQVVRIEARFNVPKVLRAALARIGNPLKDPRLFDVFSVDVAKAVLLDEMKQFDGSSPSTAREPTPVEMLEALLADGVKPDFALKAISVAQLELELTPAGLRKLLSDHGVSKAFWYDLKRFRGLTLAGRGGQELVELLRKALNDFVPIPLGVS